MTGPRVAIIGGGFGGLAVALRLTQAGHHDLTIYERADGLGGTWQANTYPRLACDAPSHIYSFSYAPNPRWSRRFAPGEEIREYLERCVDEAGLRDRVRLGTTVTRAQWDGERWQLELSDGTTDSADVLVPAVGPLSEPKPPALPGLDDFRGDLFHTAQWRHDLDLTGRRVGIIGTGASAIQAIPHLADVAGELTVFQRTAPYVYEKRDVEYSERLKRLYATVPATQRAVRWTYTQLFDFINLGFWLAPSGTRLIERMHRKYLERVVPDPDLRAKLTPDYRAGCKRPAMDSFYYPALVKPHVNVETGGIAAVEAKGVRLKDGTLVELDTLVLATGFATSGFVSSVEIVGRDGVELQEVWADGARAFLGLSVPRFPNLFLTYGPNTNLGSGSILIMIEAQAEHIASACDALRSSPEPLEVRREAYDAEVRRVARKLPRAIWSTGCGNWYLDDHGIDTHNWPGSMAGYRRRTAKVRDEDYRRVPTRSAKETTMPSGPRT